MRAHVVARGYEHAARAARGVKHGAARRLDHVHDHAHERFGREEHAVVACHGGRELAQKILVDASDDVVALFIEGGVVEDADDARQQVVTQLGVGVGQHAREAGIELCDGVHCGVNGSTRVCLRGQVEQVVVASFFRDEHGALGRIVLRLLGRFAAFDTGALFIYLSVGSLEAAPCVAQEYEA